MGKEGILFEGGVEKMEGEGEGEGERGGEECRGV